MKTTDQYFLLDGLKGSASFNTALSLLFTANVNVFFTFVLGRLDVEAQVYTLVRNGIEISSSDSQVDDVQIFKVNIIYHCYRAVARKNYD